MHEMSLALEVGRLAAERMERELLPHVTAVGVEVGDRAGVVPDALEFCLQAVLAEPPFDGARPVLERSDGDVLRLVWIEVDDGGEPGEEKPADRPGPDGSREDRDSGRTRPGRGDPRRRPDDVPLPSETGPPPGAGDGVGPGGTTEMEGETS